MKSWLQSYLRHLRPTHFLTYHSRARISFRDAQCYILFFCFLYFLKLTRVFVYVYACVCVKCWFSSKKALFPRREGYMWSIQDHRCQHLWWKLKNILQVKSTWTIQDVTKNDGNVLTFPSTKIRDVLDIC